MVSTFCFKSCVFFLSILCFVLNLNTYKHNNARSRLFCSVLPCVWCSSSVLHGISKPGALKTKQMAALTLQLTSTYTRTPTDANPLVCVFVNQHETPKIKLKRKETFNFFYCCLSHTVPAVCVCVVFVPGVRRCYDYFSKYFEQFGNRMAS